MATHFNHDCPHCLTRGVGFETRYQWAHPKNPYLAQILAVCGLCKGGMIVLSRSAHSSGGHMNVVQHDVSYPDPNFSIMQTWPAYRTQCPENVPSNIAGFYDQGVENLEAGRWDAAGAMFRKTLDVATKRLRSDLASKNLYDRIEAMVTSGDLTSAMGQWSHSIRLDGNSAIHDDEPETPDDARATQRFTEALLTYGFTLPAMVEAKRAPVKKESTEEAVA